MQFLFVAGFSYVHMGVDFGCFTAAMTNKFLNVQ
jgi:hypothetical protein